MKKSFGALMTVAALVVLSGCSAPEPKAPVEPAELPTASASTAPKVTSLKSAPEESASTDEKLFAGMTADEFYLKIMGSDWVGRDKPDDASLIAAGHDACKQLADGASIYEVSVISGNTVESKQSNTNVIAAARSTYCLDLP